MSHRNLLFSAIARAALVRLSNDCQILETTFRVSGTLDAVLPLPTPTTPHAKPPSQAKGLDATKHGHTS